MQSNQPAVTAPDAVRNGTANPPAALAARRALAKGAVEMPMVAALGPGRNRASRPPAEPGAADDGPPAAAAAPLATSKFLVERPMVAALAKRATGAAAGQPAPAAASHSDEATLPGALEAATDDAAWSKIAALHSKDAKLDAGSRALMAAKDPDALRAGRLAFSKAKVENPMVKLVRNFEHSVADDTVRNEYTFHRQIHQWLATGKTADGKPVGTLDALNEQVYAQLFLTPSSDPWLGLVPADTYTALPHEGVCKK